MRGWIGVDLDGTLAYYEGWRGPEHIGDPIPKMLERVKRWIAEGKAVRIMTARAVQAENIPFIEQWCEKYVGTILPVTFQKDFAMVQLWDDRCVQIIPNTGIRADGGE
jgi:hypothetical protein